MDGNMLIKAQDGTQFLVSKDKIRDASLQLIRWTKCKRLVGHKHMDLAVKHN